MGPLNPSKAELVVALFCFLTIFGILGGVLLPRARRVMADRADAIDGELARAQAKSREGAQALEEYRLVMAEARHEAARILQEAREEGAVAIAEARREAEQERDRMIALAQAELDADRELVEAALRVEIARISAELASRVVGEPLDVLASDSPAVRQYLDTFGASAE